MALHTRFSRRFKQVVIALGRGGRGGLDLGKLCGEGGVRGLLRGAPTRELGVALLRRGELRRRRRGHTLRARQRLLVDECRLELGDELLVPVDLLPKRGRVRGERQLVVRESHKQCLQLTQLTALDVRATCRAQRHSAGHLAKLQGVNGVARGRGRGRDGAAHDEHDVGATREGRGEQPRERRVAKLRRPLASELMHRHLEPMEGLVDADTLGDRGGVGVEERGLGAGEVDQRQSR